MEKAIAPRLNNTRKIWLYAAIAAYAALFVMMLVYVHFIPKDDFTIRFEPAAPNAAAKGTEFRVNYIMVDDLYIPLQQYAAGQWQYDGSLVTWGENSVALALTVKANRVVEVGFKRGPWMARGNINIGGVNKTIDLYSENDNTQYVERMLVHHFLRPVNLLIGVLIFFVVFVVLESLFNKKTALGYWSEKQDAGGLLCALAVLAAVFLLMYKSYIFPYRKAGLYIWDVGAYTAVGKYVAHGLMPYLDIIEGKGVVFYLLLALGQKIWEPYGIWVVEATLSLGAHIFLFAGLRKFFSRRAALFGAILAVAYQASVYQDGTSTESFSMLFLGAAFYVFALFNSAGFEVERKWLLIFGACFAAVAHIRQNNAYLFAAVVLVVIIEQLRSKRYRLLLKQAGMVALGFGVAYTAPLIWLAARGALADWVRQTWIFYLSYVNRADLGVWAKIKVGLTMLYETNIPYIALCGIGVMACLISTTVKTKQSRPEQNLRLLLLLGGAMGLFALTASGYKYPHYMQPLTPIIGLLGAYIAKTVCKIARKNQIAVDVAVALLLYTMTSQIYIQLAGGGWHTRVNFDDKLISHVKIANYIESNAKPGEKWLGYKFDGEFNNSGFIIQNLTSVFGYRNEWGQYHFLRQDVLDGYYYDDFIGALYSNPRFIVIGLDPAPDDEIAAYIYEHYSKVIDENIDLWEGNN
jgi:hypothetical protein